MTDAERVQNFRVKIDEYGNIEAEQNPNPGFGLPREKLKLEPMRQRTIETLIKILQDGRLLNRDEYEFLGENLYMTLFDNEIGRALFSLIQDGDSLVRLELQFEGQEKLAAWPWEYLFCPTRPGLAGTGYFLATQGRLVLTRHLRLNLTSPRPPTIDKLPLKVLFIAPSPRELDPVQYLRVMEELETLLEATNPKDGTDKLINVYKLVEPDEPGADPMATWGNFIDYVEEFSPHVIHFIGHGKSTPLEGGSIAFMKKDRSADWVSEQRFSEELMPIRSLRLVFLQACESALPDPYQAISGVAMKLAHLDIPAVVGMQYKVKQEIASLFARTFYAALANKQSVDKAMQMARRETQKVYTDWADLRAFGLPVLYQTMPGALLAEAASTGGVKTRTEDADNFTCPWCATKNSADRATCRNCSGDLKCPVCATPVKEKAKRCANPTCDAPLHIRCPWCDTKLEVRAGVCPNCQHTIVCTKCGDVVAVKSNTCQNGHALNQGS